MPPKKTEAETPATALKPIRVQFVRDVVPLPHPTAAKSEFAYWNEKMASACEVVGDRVVFTHAGGRVDVPMASVLFIEYAERPVADVDKA